MSFFSLPDSKFVKNRYSVNKFVSYQCFAQIGVETMETVTDFIYFGSKTVDGDCSHKHKRRLLLGRKAMTNLASILKSRDITLPTKVHPCGKKYSCMDVRVGL